METDNNIGHLIYTCIVIGIFLVLFFVQAVRSKE